MHMKFDRKKLDRVLVSMDEKNWFRMLVCFTPGVVIGKLATQFSVSGMSIAGPATLLLGVGVYYAWPRLRSLARPDDISTVAEVPVVAQPSPAPAAVVAPTLSAANHSAMMNDLVRLCDGSSQRAIELVNLEIAVDPNASYVQALERALRRASLAASKQ